MRRRNEVVLVPGEVERSELRLEVDLTALTEELLSRRKPSAPLIRFKRV